MTLTAKEYDENLLDSDNRRRKSVSYSKIFNPNKEYFKKFKNVVFKITDFQKNFIQCHL